MNPFKNEFQRSESVMTTRAFFDKDQPDVYRYSLLKQWTEKREGVRAAAILFNPSKATESMLDLTVMNLLNRLTPDPVYYAVEILNMYPIMLTNWRDVDFEAEIPPEKLKLNLDYIEYTLNRKQTRHVIVGWGAEPGGVYYDSENNRNLVQIIKAANKPVLSFGCSKDKRKRWQPRHLRMDHLLEPLAPYPHL